MKKLILFILLLSISLNCKAVAIPTSPSSTSSVTPAVLPEFPTNTVTATSTPTPTVITQTPTLSIPTPATPFFYTVKPGDTLDQIAKRFGVETADLARTNHIANINLIYVDQHLLIDSVPVTPPPTPEKSGKHIVIVLSTQMAYAYDDGILIKEFLVGTGKPSTPTIQGEFYIYLKFEKTDMTDNETYYIEDVPWTMYFKGDYGLHGAPWNPGLYQTSHGCVNMTEVDAEWLFHWAPLGTPVLVIE